jgi:hypothetical protein
MSFNIKNYSAMVSFIFIKDLYKILFPSKKLTPQYFI